eukprot:2833308-Prymnesium_polylepis.1
MIRLLATGYACRRRVNIESTAAKHATLELHGRPSAALRTIREAAAGGGRLRYRLACHLGCRLACRLGCLTRRLGRLACRLAQLPAAGAQPCGCKCSRSRQHGACARVRRSRASEESRGSQEHFADTLDLPEVGPSVGRMRGDEGRLTRPGWWPMATFWPMADDVARG